MSGNPGNGDGVGLEISGQKSEKECSMEVFPKPVIVVSKCLGFEACRYNKQIISDYFVNKLTELVNFIPICPEVEIGLGVPREPIRLVKEKEKLTVYQPATGKQFTEKMNIFLDDFFTKLEVVDGFILKNRSPSCGKGDVKIYQSFKQPSPSTRGNGFFGQRIADTLSDAAVDDEGRLRNYQIRDHFLTKLYTRARFRTIKEQMKMGALVDFHSRHKLLLLAYNQELYRQCGRIVANHENLEIREVITRYEEKMNSIFHTPFTYTAMINTLHHAFGWISDGLSQEEKQFFLNTVEEYRDERIPLSTVIHLLNSYAIRFNNEYLRNQVLLQVYPETLTEITDSGKGRKLS